MVYLVKNQSPGVVIVTESGKSVYTLTPGETVSVEKLLPDMEALSKMGSLLIEVVTPPKPKKKLVVKPKKSSAKKLKAKEVTDNG